MSFYDSKFKKTEIASRCKQKRTGGFQGCTNLGNGCDFKGFYLCKYSPEGLCTSCELEQFHDRYHGCCSCRKAIKLGSFCEGCEHGIRRWLRFLFIENIKVHSSTISIGISGLLRSKKQDLGVLVDEFPEMSDKWPGFHVGGLKWLNPDLLLLKNKINISDIGWDNKCEVLERELIKLGIDVCGEQQIFDLSKFTSVSFVPETNVDFGVRKIIPITRNH
jgi:hypothetical protein